jgi:calcium-dependent protein kinase
MDHPNIIKLVDVYEDEKYLHLVTELCLGGELFDRIIAKSKSSEGHFSERDASLIIRNMLGAIEYCHTVHNICHRDLKPENFLYTSAAADSEMKIIDFGLSRVDDEVEHMNTKVGTPFYVAPEVLTRRYDKECDLWSIGVVTFVLLCGYPPFYGDTEAEIFSSVKRGVFEFRSPEWDPISDLAKDFIRNLLQKDPAKRLTPQSALDHPWFVAALGGMSIYKVCHVKSSLTRFIGYNKLRRVALQFLAEQLSDADIVRLRAALNRADTNMDGKLSIGQLKEVLRAQGFDTMREDLREALEGFDMEDDNEIEFTSFLAATMAVNLGIREDNIRRAFNFFDKNGSGALTFDEVSDAVGGDEEAQDTLAVVDLNGDGVISYEEFKALLQGLSFHSPIFRALKDEPPHPEAGSDKSRRAAASSKGGATTVFRGEAEPAPTQSTKRGSFISHIFSKSQKMSQK